MSREAPPPVPPKPAAGNRHLLLWDGDCGFCRRIVQWIERHDTRAVFDATPYQDAPPDRVSDDLRRASAKSIHVLTADGRVLRAGRASLFVIGELGWRRTARLLMLPPFVWAVELGYRLVSDNRGRLSRWFPGSTVACRIGDRRNEN